MKELDKEVEENIKFILSELEAYIRKCYEKGSMNITYSVYYGYQGLGISCKQCGSKSRNRQDIQEKYCNNCHTFHDKDLISEII